MDLMKRVTSLARAPLARTTVAAATMLALLATAATAYAGTTPRLPGAGVPGAGVDNARIKDQFRDRMDLGTAGLGDCVDCLLGGALDPSTWAVAAKQGLAGGDCWDCFLAAEGLNVSCADECRGPGGGSGTGEGSGEGTGEGTGEAPDGGVYDDDTGECREEDQCTEDDPPEGGDSGDDILGGCSGPMQCGRIDTATIQTQAGTEIETEVPRTEIAGATGTH